MPNRAPSTLAQLGLAIGAVAAAILVRQLLSPWLGTTFPLATMFTAVAFVVWRAGWAPALGVAIGGWIAVGFIFRGGLNYFGGLTINEIIGFAHVHGRGVPVIVLGEAMRRAQQALETRQSELSTTNLALENKVEAQSLLAAIVASSADGIISKTLDGVITSWNKGAERLFGWTAEEAIGQSIHLIVPADLREQERDILDRLRRGERVEHLDVERLRKDGSRVHVSVTISPVRDRHGHIIGASKTARDITARKEWEGQLLRSEEALRRNRDELQARDEHREDGRLVARPDARHRLVEPGIRRAVRLPSRRHQLFDASACSRCSVRTIARVSPPSSARRSTSTRITPSNSRCRHAATGEWRWMEARGPPIYGADGRPTMIYGLVIDITDRRRAVEALQEADRRKDEFLATLAHELRNPLAPISSGLHILRSSGDPPQRSIALEIMERQLAQMVRLVDDLLDVARITTGKVEVRHEPLDLAVAINDAIETSQPLLGRPRQSDGDAAVAAGVRERRSHAARASVREPSQQQRKVQRGRPAGLDHDRPRRRRRRGAREGCRHGYPSRDAAARVRDVPAGGSHRRTLARRPRDRTVARETDRRAARRHRDRAERGPRPRQRVRRPPAGHRGPRGRIPAKAGPQAAAPARRKILVVDDNADAAESLAALLSINGHETRMAHDGPEALQQAERFHPDVVFLDIGMPTLDGHETAKLIRRQPWGKDMVLVALTGWGQNEDRKRSKDAGFNHHLVKPADPDGR